jgi:hypothetical protein
MFEIPLMSKSILRLWAENLTLKSVAEKLELGMQGLRERDSILRLSAAAKGRAAAASQSRAFEGEKTMVGGEERNQARAAAARYSGRVQRRGSAKPAAARERGGVEVGEPRGRDGRRAAGR